MNNNKLIFSILVLIPIIGALVYLLYANAQGTEKTIALISIIPGLNLFCAIVLILSALKIIKL